jgi:hypothetical protein
MVRKKTCYQEPSKRYTLLVPGLDSSGMTDALAFLRDARLRVFGADVHGFRLNPPLPEADLMASFGAPLAGMTPKDFQDPAWGYQIGQPPSRIDILQELTAIDFYSAWKTGEDGIIDGDIAVRYISVDDLIKNKLALGRHRDLADVEAIRESEAANAKRLTKD